MNNLLGQDISYEQLQAENAKLQAQLYEITAKYDWLVEKYLLKVKKVFGRSREMVDGQLVIEGVFNEAEIESDITQPDPTVEEVTEPIRTIVRKYSGQRKAKLEGLPVERIEYELPEEERNCDNCAEPLPELQPNIRTRIEVIPAQVKVIEEVQHVYAPCNKCDINEQLQIVETSEYQDQPVEKTELRLPAIINAPMPEAAIPHGMATESTSLKTY